MMKTYQGYLKPLRARRSDVSTYEDATGACVTSSKSRPATVKSHDRNGVVTILSSSNQRLGPYQRRTFEMTTFSGSRRTTLPPAVVARVFAGILVFQYFRQIHIPTLRASSSKSSLIHLLDLASETVRLPVSGTVTTGLGREANRRQNPRLARKSLKIG